jgi:hypothetical protein
VLGLLNAKQRTKTSQGVVAEALDKQPILLVSRKICSIDEGRKRNREILGKNNSSRPPPRNQESKVTGKTGTGGISHDLEI